MDFSERIKFVRRELFGRMTQTEFGYMLGMSKDMIANLECGRVSPTPYVLRLISSVCKINQHWLETGQGEPKINQSGSLAEEIRDIMRGENPFKTAIMTSLEAMPDSFWDEWSNLLNDELKKQGWHA